VPFISYLSALQKSQLLSDDMVNGVEIRCEEKGSCPAGCHLRSGEQPSPIPVLLEVSRVVPLYSLVQDNVTKEAFKSATMSSYWCAGKGDVIDNWCRCDLSAFSKDGLPNCSPLRQPTVRLAPYLEPSSTMVALEWMDVEPLIGCKVSDYSIQHKRVEDPSEAEVYTGRKTLSDVLVVNCRETPNGRSSKLSNCVRPVC
uniref:Astrotactin 2 n=1 Tax=Cyclopterus lumpus TaxID=8103 RepID=A0A8C3FXG5_CYCLU